MVKLSYEELTEFPTGKAKKTEKIFPLFDKLPRDKTLKIRLKDFELSLAGFRHILEKWNKTDKRQLEYSGINCKTENATVYIKYEEV